MRARFVVDWDDTLVEDRWPDQGPWLPGAVSALHALNRLGDVVIFSCRVADYAFPSAPHWHGDTLRPSHEVDIEVNRMREMLKAEGLGHLEIWQRGYKPAATAYIDNRAIRFTGNWDETLDDMLDVISVPLERRAPTVEKSPLDNMTIKSWTPPKPNRHPVGSRVRALRDYQEFLGKKIPAGSLGTVEEPTALSEYDETLVRFDAAPDNRFFCKYEDVEPLRVMLPAQDLTERVRNLPPFGPNPVGAITDAEEFDPPVLRVPKDRHPSSQRFHDRLEDWGNLHDSKQADYGSDADPFANVRGGAAKMGLPPWVGAVIRMNDKMERLNKAAKQYIETGEISLANEGVIDSFDDMGVYAGIGATLFEEES